MVDPPPSLCQVVRRLFLGVPRTKATCSVTFVLQNNSHVISFIDVKGGKVRERNNGYKFHFSGQTTFSNSSEIINILLGDSIVIKAFVLWIFIEDMSSE